MSRIGKLPIEIAEGVNVTINGNDVKVTGPKGELQISKDKSLNVKIEDGKILVSKNVDLPNTNALYGLTRTLIANMVTGVSKGFEKSLIFKGTGYRASVEGESLVLHMGFFNPVDMKVPDGLSVKVVKNTIKVEGYDKQKVGQFAAEIRSVKKPEPYKGKGIRYSDEVIRRKAGKTATK